VNPDRNVKLWRGNIASASSPEEVRFSGLQATAKGNLVAAGVFSGSLDLGQGAMQSAGQDLFVARLAPDLQGL